MELLCSAINKELITAEEAHKKVIDNQYKEHLSAIIGVINTAIACNKLFVLYTCTNVEIRNRIKEYLTSSQYNYKVSDAITSCKCRSIHCDCKNDGLHIEW